MYIESTLILNKPITIYNYSKIKLISYRKLEIKYLNSQNMTIENND